MASSTTGASASGRCSKLRGVPDHMTSELSDRVDHDHDGKKPRVIAFYLPQFHPIRRTTRGGRAASPNGATSCVRGRSSPGHEQPHLPTNSASTTCGSPKCASQQAELARGYGIEGFCYYHYWFRVAACSSAPSRTCSRSGEPDFPFCLAGRTRTGPGPGMRSARRAHRAGVRPEADVAHIDYLIRTLEGPRYIMVDGRPLLHLPGPGMPDPVRTFDLWRSAPAPWASTISTSSSSTRTGTSNRRKATAPTRPRNSYRMVCTRTCGSSMWRTATAAMPCSGTSTWPASSRGGPHPIGSDFRA